jgi:hypothetical protein
MWRLELVVKSIAHTVGLPINLSPLGARAPPIGRRRIAVQKETRVATAHIDVSHGASEDCRPFFAIAFICRNHHDSSRRWQLGGL